MSELTDKLRAEIKELEKSYAGRPCSLGEVSAALGEHWHAFWTNELAIVVSQSGDQATATPGVSFHELVTQELEFTSRVYVAERGLRRIERRLQFEAFLEDRSFADFRANLDQPIGRLLEDLNGVKESVSDAEATLHELMAALDRLVGVSEGERDKSFGELLPKMKAAVVQEPPTLSRSAVEEFLHCVEALGRVKAVRPATLELVEVALESAERKGALQSVDRKNLQTGDVVTVEALRRAVAMLRGSVSDRDRAQTEKLMDPWVALATMVKHLGLHDVFKGASTEQFQDTLKWKAYGRENLRRLVNKPSGSSIAAIYSWDWEAVRERGALAVSLMRVEELARTLEDQASKVALYEAARKTHGQVQKHWGTWTRRIRSPIAAGIVVFAVLLVAYRALGAYLPAGPLFFLTCTLPVIWSCVRYRREEEKIQEGPSKLREVLAPLRPPGDLGTASHTSSYWDPSYRTDPKGVMRSVRSELEAASIRTLPARIEANPGWKSLVALAGFVAAFLLLPAFAWNLVTPPDALVTIASGQTCAEVPGKVIWPGPLGIVVERVASQEAPAKRERISLDTARVLLVQYGEAVKSQCREASLNVTRLAPTFVYFGGTPDQSFIQSRATWSLPFPVKKVSCDPSSFRTAAETSAWPDSATQDKLANFSKLLTRCGKRAKPIIDVRGYASPLQFDCAKPTQELNDRLAEARRRNVLSILEKEPEFWKRVVVHRMVDPLSDEPRWTKDQTFRITAFEFVDRVPWDKQAGDAKEEFARRVELEVIYAGDCTDHSQ